jgi:hypothetical protein
MRDRTRVGRCEGFRYREREAIEELGSGIDDELGLVVPTSVDGCAAHAAAFGDRVDRELI